MACSGLVLLTCALLIACESPPREPVRAPTPPVDGTIFSGQTAWQHMRAFNELGSRVAGSREARLARIYVKREFEKLGLSVVEQPAAVVDTGGQTVGLTHVTGIIEGRSEDILLLATHYDTSPFDNVSPRRTDQRASGVALLLELARTLTAHEKPEYTIWLTFIDGDALDPAAETVSNSRMGSQSLVAEWKRLSLFDQIRAAFFYGNVGDRDLPILRDIDSPRMYREEFWEAAAGLGFEETFSRNSGYGPSGTGREVFADAGLRASVALANAHELDAAVHRSGVYPGDTVGREPSVKRAFAGFSAVGNVSVEALNRIASKLRKIDRFALSPLTAGRSEGADTQRTE